jgi:hypothetical protein
MQTPWEYRYAHRMQSMKSSVIRELLKLTERRFSRSRNSGKPAIMCWITLVPNPCNTAPPKAIVPCVK